MARYTNGFRQIDDPEPDRLSPLFTPTRAWTCNRCKTERKSGLARWLWRSTTEKHLVCSKCVPLPEWSHKLTGGTGLTWPRSLNGESVGSVTFSFHTSDWDATYSHGKGGVVDELPTDWFEDDEASLDYELAA